MLLRNEAPVSAIPQMMISNLSCTCLLDDQHIRYVLIHRFVLKVPDLQYALREHLADARISSVLRSRLLQIPLTTVNRRHPLHAFSYPWYDPPMLPFTTNNPNTSIWVGLFLFVN